MRTICREICRQKNITPGTIEESIFGAVDEIFSDIWKTYQMDYKTTLEIKILRHYYTREIGAETVALWKFQLNRTMSEIMPKYNTFYKALSELSENSFFADTNIKESYNRSGSDTEEGSGSTTGTAKNNGTQSTETSTKNNAENSGTSWQEYSDTPQGAITGLDAGNYLTNATKNQNSATNTGTASSSGSTKTENNGETSGTSTSTRAAKSTEEYVKTLIGKNGTESYIDLYNKLVSSYNDIDMMIINDLNDCFINLWE